MSGPNLLTHYSLTQKWKILSTFIWPGLAGLMVNLLLGWWGPALDRTSWMMILVKSCGGTQWEQSKIIKERYLAQQISLLVGPSCMFILHHRVKIGITIKGNQVIIYFLVIHMCPLSNSIIARLSSSCQSNLVNYHCWTSHPPAHPATPGTLLPLIPGSWNLACKLNLQ